MPISSRVPALVPPHRIADSIQQSEHGRLLEHAEQRLDQLHLAGRLHALVADVVQAVSSGFSHVHHAQQGDQDGDETGVGHLRQARRYRVKLVNGLSIDRWQRRLVRNRVVLDS